MGSSSDNDRSVLPETWSVSDCCVGCGACVEASELLQLDLKAGVAVLARQPATARQRQDLVLAASICPVMAIRRANRQARV